MKKWATALLFFALSLALCAGSCALSEPAREITAECGLRGTPFKGIESVRDGNYATQWSSSARTVVTITAPEGEKISGVYVQFYKNGSAFDLQVQNEAGEWEKTVGCDTTYLTGYAALETPVSQVRLRAREGNGRLIVSELHVFAEGETPDWVQRWNPPCEDADLLVISAHPDDEMLFMGGTIPYYAGERKLDVQVAYLTSSAPYRKLELLDGLWLCGVRNYPDLATFPDTYKLSAREMYKVKGWEIDRVTRYVAGLYRRYRPEVVVTHDVAGEYGHGAHKVAADMAQRCLAPAADPAYQHQKLAYTEPWEVKKLYLHLYDQGQLRMDWRVPLEAFGGKTAFDMAAAAFQCHTSQLRTEYAVEDWGPYDNAIFGLAHSTVGEDEAKNDFFEHIAP